MKKLLLVLCMISSAHAQTMTTMDYVESGIFGKTTYKLETSVYEPKEPNGKVVIFNHGSTGGHQDSIKKTLKMMNISNMLMSAGYTVIVPMRKGRGNSEGPFTEETGSCKTDKLWSERNEAADQLLQIVSQVKEKYHVQKVILMGHSRGGFLSMTYAADHPNEISHVVDLSGTWSAACDGKSGYARDAMETAAKKFQKQYWVYVNNDSYFSSATFNDPGYQWIRNTAESNGLVFKNIDDGGEPDGHRTTVWKPKMWLPEVIEWLKN